MYLTNIILCVFLIIFTGASDNNVSFEDVTITWKFGNNEKVISNVTSSNNFKENLPEVSEKIGATLNGVVKILYENSVSDVENLETLTISGVGLEKIEPKAFRNLPQLKYLILSKNNLIEIKSETFLHLNLSILNIDSNSISTFQPGAFKDITIQHLSINNNKIATLPAGVFENIKMRSLQLYNNEIQEIQPGTFKSVSELATLTLPENKLEEINPDAFDLPDLRSLDLSFNQIKILRPGDLKNVPKLETLELVANKLEEIPEGVFNNSKLSHLKLNHNQILTISSTSFDDMLELSVIHIDNNNLTQWDNNWLHNTPKLAYMVAGFNQFEEIPDEAFKNYPKMYSIDLQQNKIRKISSKAFDKLKSVVNFGLRENEIEHFDVSLLKTLYVGTLDLSDNKLKCLDGDLREISGNVDFIQVDGNPLSDECRTKVEEFLKYKESHPSVH